MNTMMLKKTLTKTFSERGTTKLIVVTVGMQNFQGNPGPYFSLTADVYRGTTIRESAWESSGRHDKEIRKHFPQLAHLAQWGGWYPNGPGHYPQNALYFADNRDCWGLLKGEASKNPRQQETRIRFGGSPLTHKIGEKLAELIRTASGPWEIVTVEHVSQPGETYKFRPKYTFKGIECEWYKCPFDTLREAEEWKEALETCEFEFVSCPTFFGEGKEREFDLARSSANWPEATDEELSVGREELSKVLMARLPGMCRRFREDMRKLFGSVDYDKAMKPWYDILDKEGFFDEPQAD